MGRFLLLIRQAFQVSHRHQQLLKYVIVVLVITSLATHVIVLWTLPQSNVNRDYGKELARFLSAFNTRLHDLEASNATDSNLTLVSSPDEKGETKKKPTADALSWCEEFQQNLTSAGIADPNEVNGTKERYTFKTITDPPFFMSVHRRGVDWLRFQMMEAKTYYEKQMTANFVKILTNRPISGRVIDVGMNVGWFTLLSRSLGHEVLSFEPNPSNIIRLCESLALNNWADGVIIYPYALGDIEVTMLLSWPLKNPGQARLGSKNINSISVVAKRLDDIVMSKGWLKDNDKPIYLLKIDVEGFEPNVLEGSRQLLQSGLVENILMEFQPGMYNDSSRTNRMISLFLQNNYELIGLLDSNGDHITNATNHIRFDNLTFLVSDLVKLTQVRHVKHLNLAGRLVNLWWKKKVA